MSLSNPLVSVVIPAYNAEPFIRDALDSLMAQTYPNLEVLVVDDGSTDGTRQAVMSYGDRVKYAFEENSGGCSRPRNLGIDRTSGELIAFLDADDVMAKDRLAVEVEFLTPHPDAALVFSNFQPFWESGLRGDDHFSTCPRLSPLLSALQPGVPGLVLEPSVSTELLLTENFGSSSPMVRRTAVDAVGQFDESLRACEDFDFVYRVAAHYPIGIASRVGWFKRQHRDNMTTNTENMYRHIIVTRQRLLARERIPRRRRKLKRALAQYHLGLAYYYTGRDNALALRHAVSSLRFWPAPNPRHFARILLDVLGRDTLHLGTTRGSA